MENQPLEHTLEMAALLGDYLRNTISAEDRARLEAWLAADERNRQVLEELLDGRQAAGHWQHLAYYNKRTEAARNKVAAAITRKRGKMRAIYFYRAAAAAVLLIVAATVWLLLDKPAPGPAPTEQLAVIPPGTDKARLVMGNGKVITLDKNNDTAFVQGASVNVIPGQALLAYEEDNDEAVQVHELITPKGGQYHLRLEDGTEVWLNAASSITFPTRFGADARSVEITGEAYFEVAKDAARPFRVKIGGENNQVEVLGTRFNVNAYKDEENIHTTLLDGSVRVWRQGEGAFRKMMLKPGQQAVTAHAGENGDIRLQAADTVRAMAWKNGFFDFNDVKLAEVMRQVSRWYDIEVVYENGIPDIKVWGRMTRDQNLQQLIAILSSMDVKIRLEKGNRLIVLQ